MDEKSLKVVITGSRYWEDGDLIKKALQCYNIKTLIHGGARGADSLADTVAKALNINVLVFEAEWDKYGTKAGPIRNRKMLDQKPDLVIAFNTDLKHSSGTLDTVREALKRNIPVKLYELAGIEPKYLLSYEDLLNVMMET